MLGITPIVRLLHGSRLYGTVTATSDTDFKGVHLPSGKAILLGEPEMVVTRDTRPEDAHSNGPEDIDDQSYALAKFLGMLSTGDTVATEMIFAPRAALVTTSAIWETLQANRHRLINRECRGFVGYCVQQARTYSLKGERLAACEALVMLLEEALAELGPRARLSDIRPAVAAFVADPAHGASLEHISGRHGLIEHLVCLDRKTPIGVRISDTLALYRRVSDQYGKRAAAARDAGNVDWKAMSHALRVARQAEELLATGELVLPRPDAVYLTEVKLGHHPFEAVRDELLALVERLPGLASASPLPETSDQAWIRDFILEHHHAQIVRRSSTTAFLSSGQRAA